jgi:hypothetical protein
MPAGHVSCQFARAGPPASLSSLSGGHPYAKRMSHPKHKSYFAFAGLVHFALTVSALLSWLALRNDAVCAATPSEAIERLNGNFQELSLSAWRFSGWPTVPLCASLSIPVRGDLIWPVLGLNSLLWGGCLCWIWSAIAWTRRRV